MEASSYAKGFELGRSWKMGYTPGGPWKATHCLSKPKPCKICEENHKEYDDWHEGFAAGKLFQPNTEI